MRREPHAFVPRGAQEAQEASGAPSELVPGSVWWGDPAAQHVGQLWGLGTWSLNPASTTQRCLTLNLLLHSLGRLSSCLNEGGSCPSCGVWGPVGCGRGKGECSGDVITDQRRPPRLSWLQ